MQSVARITVEEAAEQLDVSVATIRRWCVNQQIDAIKIGKQWLVDPKSLAAVRSRTRKSTAKPNDAPYDLEQAWRYIRHTDVSELWVPEVVRCRDFVDRPDELIREAAERLSTMRFMPALRIDVPKTVASNRPGVMLEMADRIAYQAVVGSFAARIDESVSANVYSSRISTSQNYFFRRPSNAWTKFTDSVRTNIGPGQMSWVAQTDITGYFEHIHHNILFEELSALGISGQPLRALRVMLSKWCTVEGVGLPQGPNASRLLGNFYLAAVDESMEAKGYVYRRYMDDIRILAHSKSEAVEAVRDFEKFCRERGLSCSSNKTKVLSAEEYLAGSDTAELDAAAYSFNAGHPGAQPMLRKILKQALSAQGVDATRVRFSVWRLARVRDASAINTIIKNLEHLAPFASVVGAYLRPFITRRTLQPKLTEFLSDSQRSYSHHLRAWLFAAMLESRVIPVEWADLARENATNLNLPPYLRSVAGCVLAKSQSARDIAWLKSRLALEHDPDVLRANLVALKYGNALNKREVKVVTDRQPRLHIFGEWLLSQGNALPSLLFADQKINVP
ncbi:reverse transcriptase domain-containing protein [Mycobacteroides chelonae]|uniref:reverse transcriptase domain-containing protein n=1 Tax=Mycobacteroides chelonae TaxID=1774 RepID=UPI0008A923CA|nr:reverse transcriptase domain-containing protein [Mycobacteroides chelonae]AYM41246.1 helix-turn-helix domain-containing protein [[Mycobacterium] chelonae subsp. gwanakae]OHU12332.1 hypothetical protein BKG75_22765 [Mycobacteroides chelonae]